MLFDVLHLLGVVEGDALDASNGDESEPWRHISARRRGPRCDLAGRLRGAGAKLVRPRPPRAHGPRRRLHGRRPRHGTSKTTTKKNQSCSIAFTSRPYRKSNASTSPS